MWEASRCDCCCVGLSLSSHREGENNAESIQSNNIHTAVNIRPAESEGVGVGVMGRVCYIVCKREREEREADPEQVSIQGNNFS